MQPSNTPPKAYAVNAGCPGTIDTAFARTSFKEAEEFEALSTAVSSRNICECELIVQK